MISGQTSMAGMPQQAGMQQPGMMGAGMGMDINSLAAANGVMPGTPGSQYMKNNPTFQQL